MKLLVPEEADGERLDRFLAESLPQYSREFLKSLVVQGHVTLDETAVTKPSFRISQDQEFVLDIPEVKPLALEAELIPLEVLYEDNELLVVNKPSSMLTHPGGREQNGTLVNALLAHCKGNLSGINGVERPGIVHRLDKETSGLLMVAKTDLSHRRLQQQIQDRTAKRCYRTIVQGIMPKASGTVIAPIGRNPKRREAMAVVSDGRFAVTEWEVTDTIGKSFTILKLSLGTGRTHQIRVHMAYLGHPIFADPLYGTGLEKRLKFNAQGQILQAFQLSFIHPVTGEPLSFEIPPDAKFEAALTFLREKS